MYLHIGNDIVIKKDQLIGIFNYETLIQNENLKKLFEKIEKEGKIIDISDGNEKSIILIQQGLKWVVYISNISSNTLAKRNEI